MICAQACCATMSKLGVEATTLFPYSRSCFHLASHASQGNSLLHYASQAGYNEAIKSLLDKGAWVDGRNLMGQTPLHVACDEATVQTLLQSVPNPEVLYTVEDNFGRTPLQEAAASSRQSAAAALVWAGAPVCACKDGTPFESLGTGATQAAIALALQGTWLHFWSCFVAGVPYNEHYNHPV